MDDKRTTFILGCGAVGLPLAAFIAKEGRDVIAVRTRREGMPRSTMRILVHTAEGDLQAAVETISLSELTSLNGVVVITAKSFANPGIAEALKQKMTQGSLVVLQNGLNVERPFLEAQFPQIHRGILYVTSQAISDIEFVFRTVTSSPVGTVQGDEMMLDVSLKALTSDRFPFHMEKNIQKETWKKVIINSVFNSICPLLEVDNGIFARDPQAFDLAGQVVRECTALTDRLHLGLNTGDLMDQVMLISRKSDGQLISTLQDIRNGRETEIGFLNLEIVRIAASQTPAIDLPITGFLGSMILAKSRYRNLQGKTGD